MQGVNLYLQSAQDINVGGRLARTQYQYTLTDPDIVQLSVWAPRVLERLRALPQLADVVSDQQTSAAALNLAIDRDRASSYGISPSVIDATIYDAIGQRQVVQYFTQLNTYHVILEVLPQMQQDPSVLDKIYVTSPTLGKQIPVATFVTIDNTKTNYLSVSHQSQFPAITISFNLASGVALGDAVEAIEGAMKAIGAPNTMIAYFSGDSAGLPELRCPGAARPHRGSARRGLHRAGIALRKLHPPAYDSVDASLRGRWRAADSHALRLRSQRDRADRHHPPHRHREERKLS